MITYHESTDTIPPDALIVGIEATRPDHRAAVEASSGVNIDPQHGMTMSKILGALEGHFGPDWVCPPEWGRWGVIHPDQYDPEELGPCPPIAACTVAAVSSIEYLTDTHIALLTSRPDLDSVCGMAVVGMADAELRAARERLAEVARADAFAPGAPWEARPLPTAENIWGPPISGPVDAQRHLAPLHAVAQDRDLPLAERVAMVRHWLLAGEEPEGYRERVEESRLALVEGAEVTLIDPDIVHIRSTHPGALGLGYHVAPVVIAENPTYAPVGGLKWTVAFWYAPTPEQFAALVAALNEAEAEAEAGGDPTWGGNPTSGIVGSSQRQPSRLSVADVWRAVVVTVPPNEVILGRLAREAGLDYDEEMAEADNAFADAQQEDRPVQCPHPRRSIGGRIWRHHLSEQQDASLMDVFWGEDDGEADVEAPALHAAMDAFRVGDPEVFTFSDEG